MDKLMMNKYPISAQKIHGLCKGQVDLASVYRTLSILESLKIVFKDRFDNKDLYYIADEQHHHIVCKKCGYMKCIPCNHLYERISGFKQISHSLTITGICSNCS